jgi:hypothetical protein
MTDLDCRTRLAGYYPSIWPANMPVTPNGFGELPAVFRKPSASESG